jgi:hypothetical protein
MRALAMTSLRCRLAMTAGWLAVAMASGCAPGGPQPATLPKEVEAQLKERAMPPVLEWPPRNLKDQATRKSRTFKPRPIPGRPTAGLNNHSR